MNTEDIKNVFKLNGITYKIQDGDDVVRGSAVSNTIANNTMINNLKEVA